MVTEEYTPVGGDPGALLNVMVELRPSDETSIRALAETMGFRLIPATAEVTRDIKSQSATVSSAVDPQPKAATPVNARKNPSEALGQATTSQIGQAVRSTLEHRASMATSRWMIDEATKNAQSFPEPQSEAGPDEILVPPLLTESWQRSILFTAMATESEGEEIDTDRFVETMAAMTEVEYLPRKKRQTLRRGGDILIDINPGLEPFTHDCTALAQLITRMMDPDYVRILYFRGIPSNAGGKDGSDWASYTPQGLRPVLLITDLGCSRNLVPGGRGTKEWVEFAETLRRARCRPMVLTPYRTDVLPVSLTAMLPVAAWDRGTTPGTLRRLLSSYASTQL